MSTRNEEFKNMNYSGFDSILHVASIVHQKKYVSQDDYYSVNVKNTIEIAELAKKAGVRQFIFISSMAVYGDNETQITNSSKLQPSNLYGKTKLMAEEKLLGLQDDKFIISILRPPMIYGKDCPGNYKTLSKLARRIHVFPTIENQRSMIYIDNLSECIWNIINAELSGIFYPQNIELVNTYNLVREIANCYNHKVMGFSFLNPIIKTLIKYNRLIRKIFGNLYYTKEMSHIKEFNYQVVTFEESIKETEV